MGRWRSGEGERESLLKNDTEALADRPSKYGAVEEIDLCEETRYEEKAAGGRRTPLPMKQLAVLLAMRAVEPLAYSQIFPVRATFHLRPRHHADSGLPASMSIG